MTGMRIAIIGGSGLGERLREGMDTADTEEVLPDTPFGAPSAPIVTGTWSGTPIALLPRHGPGHVRNPSAVPYRANVFALKALGCTHVIASGATGSLREEIAPGHLVICDQLIDRTDGRPRTFYENAAVHVEFADPVCAVMRDWLIDAAAALDGVTVHERGTYVCMEGPGFSTRAESRMHRAWGADLVGMTALPEARLVREAEMAYALVALPTDYDCWRERPAGVTDASLIAEIMGNLGRATDACLELLRRALGNVAPLRVQRSAAHDALDLAVWTPEEHIPARERERLRVLWGRRFGEASE